MTEREDLGAALHRLTRAVIEREQVLLAELDLDMWDYVTLARLDTGPAPTQGQLALAVGRDATRLIPILDRLQERGLLDRAPDPQDRRNRIVTLTPPGRATLLTARRAIHAMEDALFADVAAQDRATFERVLRTLEAATGARPGDLPAPGQP
jgi:DNA-binding MarR family transcriptional regulator